MVPAYKQSSLLHLYKSRVYLGQVPHPMNDVIKNPLNRSAPCCVLAKDAIHCAAGTGGSASDLHVCDVDVAED